MSLETSLLKEMLISVYLFWYKMISGLFFLNNSFNIMSKNTLIILGKLK